MHATILVASGTASRRPTNIDFSVAHTPLVWVARFWLAGAAVGGGICAVPGVPAVPVGAVPGAGAGPAAVPSPVGGGVCAVIAPASRRDSGLANHVADASLGLDQRGDLVLFTVVVGHHDAVDLLAQVRDV